MSFLKRWFRPGGPAGTEESEDDRPDGTLGYNRAPAFYQYLMRRQYDDFARDYQTLPADGRELVINGIMSRPTLDYHLSTWASEQPDLAVTCLLRGINLTRQAWEARTAKLARDEPDQRARWFFDALQQARAYLTQAARLDPDDVLAPARLIPVLMGLEAGERTILTQLAVVKLRQPDHLGAHMATLLSLTPKWGGSVERMNAFADHHYADGRYPLLTALKLAALLEEWHEAKRTGDEETHRTFFDNPARRALVVGLHEQFNASPGESVQVPLVQNYFALLLLKVSEPQRARQIIRDLRGRMSIQPWQSVGITSYRALLQR